MSQSLFLIEESRGNSHLSMEEKLPLHGRGGGGAPVHEGSHFSMEEAQREQSPTLYEESLSFSMDLSLRGVSFVSFNDSFCQ